jgi:hypothetical protein
MIQQNFKHTLIKITQSKSVIRTLYVAPVKKTQRVSNLKIDDYTEKQAQAIIVEHIINKSSENNDLYHIAKKINLIETLLHTTTFLRGESFYETRDIPDGIYELDKNTSITPTTYGAKRFSGIQYNNVQDVTDHLQSIINKFISFAQGKDYQNPKKGRIITVTVPQNCDLIKIIPFDMDNSMPEYTSFIPEYVIPAGTLIRSENKGQNITVLSQAEEQQERPKTSLDSETNTQY